MKFLIDEGVPVSVGNVLQKIAQEVIHFNQSGLVKGSADPVVCIAAQAAGAILVAADKDMKTLAKGHGITKARFSQLGLLKFNCPKTMMTQRTHTALTIIQHEFAKVQSGECDRVFVEIGESIIRIHR